MSDGRHTNEMFDDLLVEVNQYMPIAEKDKFIYGGYGRLVASLSPEQGINNPFNKLSLNVADHIAKLGFRGVYFACTFLYKPFLDKRISEHHINSLFGKEGKFVIFHLQSLITLGIVFEGYLPWIKANASLGNEEKEQLDGFRIEKEGLSKREKAEFWDGRNEKRNTVAFLAISREPEIAIIKLLERLYLLKDLNNFPVKQDLHHLVAKDTLEIYSPVAEVLGAWSIKSPLDDMAFKIIQPEIYKAIAKDLQERLPERQSRIERAIEKITFVLLDEGLEAEVTGRPKHIYGIFKKIQSGQSSISEINDVLGVRIIVDKATECYVALNILGRRFQLAEDVYEDGKTYRDWIVSPKPNKYQSIHTTILFEGRWMEVQIRTKAMHYLAEYGAAAHWLYRRAGNSTEQQKQYQEYIEQIAEFRKLYESFKRRK